jgi:RNA polymerase sigma-70 factor (ECF subfamily)
VVSDPSDDRELVDRYLAGDAAAFTTLVERHQARVYSVCLRVIGNPEDAADATQEAFISALRKLGQFRGDSAFSTWMHRVAVNSCYDLLRKRSRQPMLHLPTDQDEPERELGPPMPDHADEVASTRDAAAALALVPDEFRVALVLADVQDLPYHQISEILDVPVGTVKSRVFRGRIALARAMGIEREPRGRSQPSEDEA